MHSTTAIQSVGHHVQFKDQIVHPAKSATKKTSSIPLCFLRAPAQQRRSNFNLWSEKRESFLDLHRSHGYRNLH